MTNASRLSAEDLIVVDTARALLAQRAAHLDPQQLAALSDHLRVLAEAGLARHSDGTLNPGALAEAARLAAIVSSAPPALTETAAL